jgi:hypothetical protein
MAAEICRITKKTPSKSFKKRGNSKKEWTGNAYCLVNSIAWISYNWGEL